VRSGGYRPTRGGFDFFFMRAVLLCIICNSNSQPKSFNYLIHSSTMHRQMSLTTVCALLMRESTRELRSDVLWTADSDSLRGAWGMLFTTIHGLLYCNMPEHWYTVDTRALFIYITIKNNSFTMYNKILPSIILIISQCGYKHMGMLQYKDP